MARTHQEPYLTSLYSTFPPREFYPYSHHIHKTLSCISISSLFHLTDRHFGCTYSVFVLQAHVSFTSTRIMLVYSRVHYGSEGAFLEGREATIISLLRILHVIQLSYNCHIFCLLHTTFIRYTMIITSDVHVWMLDTSISEEGNKKGRSRKELAFFTQVDFRPCISITCWNTGEGC